MAWLLAVGDSGSSAAPASRGDSPRPLQPALLEAASEEEEGESVFLFEGSADLRSIGVETDKRGPPSTAAYYYTTYYCCCCCLLRDALALLSARKRVAPALPLLTRLRCCCTAQDLPPTPFPFPPTIDDERWREGGPSARPDSFCCSAGTRSSYGGNRGPPWWRSRGRVCCALPPLLSLLLLLLCEWPDVLCALSSYVRPVSNAVRADLHLNETPLQGETRYSS